MPATGTATCAANLGAGATHHIVATVGGRYTGTGAGDVRHRPRPSSPPPSPTPAATTSTTAAALPVAAQLAPSLSRVAPRLRITSTGRVALALRCRTIGTGTAPSTCAGTLRLTATLGRRRQSIGTATFSFPRAATKTVRVRLSARARLGIRRTTPATLTVAVPNQGAATRRATKAVRILPRLR